LISFERAGLLCQGYILTNIETFETVRHSAAFAELVFDDESGCGALLSTSVDGSETYDELDDLFTKHLYYGNVTNERIIHEAGPGGIGAVQMSLDDDAVKYRSATATFFVGVSESAVELACVCFHRARLLEQRLFWPVRDIYTSMNMKSYGGCPSKWSNALTSRWTKTFTKELRHCQFVYSTFTSSQTKSRNELPWRSRCLPFVSVSTLGLLMLMSRWSLPDLKRGALRNDDARSISEPLLNAILAPLSKPGARHAWSLVLVFDPNWRCKWPRPSLPPDGRNSIQFTITDGNVNLKPLVDASRCQCPNKYLQETYNIVRDWLPADATMSLGGFLQLTSGCARLTSIFVQVLRASSVCLESRAILIGAGNFDFGAMFAWETIDQALSGASLDLKLAQYVLDGRGHMSGTHHYTIATDKAIVCKLPLHDTIIANPSGRAVLCCPVVRSACAHVTQIN
jgi:hypothetical protein